MAAARRKQRAAAAAGVQPDPKRTCNICYEVRKPVEKPFR